MKEHKHMEGDLSTTKDHKRWGHKQMHSDHSLIKGHKHIKENNSLMKVHKHIERTIHS
jgi:hypothetical protein